MLVPIEPRPGSPQDTSSLPHWLTPLVDAARDGRSTIEPVQALVESMGFASFLYAVGTSAELNRDQRFYFWTSVPREWIAEYDARSYVEVDPRVEHGWKLWPPPLIWDGRTGAHRPEVAHFLDRAAAFGIGSGLAIYLHDGGHKIMFALNRRERRLTPALRARIAGVTARAMYLGTVLHSVFLSDAIARGTPPLQQGSPLSPRERQCLKLAAHGMTSVDIGGKLGITERTANFHFSNIITKLGVLNRKEAIAMGVCHGLIDVDAAVTPLSAPPSSRIREAQIRRWEKLRDSADDSLPGLPDPDVPPGVARKVP